MRIARFQLGQRDAQVHLPVARDVRPVPLPYGVEHRDGGTHSVDALRRNFAREAAIDKREAPPVVRIMRRRLIEYVAHGVAVEHKDCPAAAFEPVPQQACDSCLPCAGKSCDPPDGARWPLCHGLNCCGGWEGVPHGADRGSSIISLPVTPLLLRIGMLWGG